MNKEEVRALLAEATKEAGSPGAWSKKHSIAPAYVIDVLNSRRDAGPLILTALGIEKTVSYARKG